MDHLESALQTWCLSCVSVQNYTLDVQNYQCLDDKMFNRTSAISPTLYVHRTNLQALSNLLAVSIAFTVPEIHVQLTKADCEGVASSSEVVPSPHTQPFQPLLDELISELIGCPFIGNIAARGHVARLRSSHVQVASMYSHAKISQAFPPIFHTASVKNLGIGKAGYEG